MKVILLIYLILSLVSFLELHESKACAVQLNHIAGPPLILKLKDTEKSKNLTKWWLLVIECAFFSIYE